MHLNGGYLMASIVSLYEFLQRFPSEDECFQYLEEKRWPNGFRCPTCGHDAAYFLAKYRRFQCVACNHQTSVTAGTVFHKLRQPLVTLFWAVYLVGTSKKGISAMELKRKLGLRSYQTSWLLLHKIRFAMASSGTFTLTSDVEVDETYIGGRRPGKRGRGADGKSLVAAAVETDGRSMGRACLQTIDNASSHILKTFVENHVRPGVKVTSDSFSSYAVLMEKYLHNPRKRSHAEPDDDVLPKVHIVIANLKMWLCGTYNCLPSKHLQKYLDEFIFRFNRRWNLGAIFDALLLNCLFTPSFTYAELTG